MAMCSKKIYFKDYTLLPSFRRLIFIVEMLLAQYFLLNFIFQTKVY